MRWRKRDDEAPCACNLVEISQVPRALWRIGGRTRTRTLDPLIKSQLLYQLSYAPRCPRERASLPKPCRRVQRMNTAGPTPGGDALNGLFSALSTADHSRSWSSS